MIKILDDNTINLIAAGEVVERPLSVVKELVENSIDAGATAITVEIKGGGIDFIRVTDDGSGIESDDIKTAFLRHATSKISGSDDLHSIKSMGFRGEALSSICAVARIELITRTHESISGMRYVIEGSTDELTEIGAPEGTTFIIRDLFYNTPARREFLKSATTEGRVIEECMEHFSLSHPHIRWQFISEGKNKLSTAGDGNIKSSIYYAYGSDIAKVLVPIDFSDDSQDMPSGIRVSGYIAKPEFSRGNRSYMNYFVNGRYIRSQIISTAILDGYRDYLMNHRYPFTALCIDISPEEMDVNVHPAKLEVRFSDEKSIYEVIFNAVKNTLDRITLIPEESLDTASDKKLISKITKKEAAIEQKVHNPEPFEQQRMKLEFSGSGNAVKQQMHYLDREVDTDDIIYSNTDSNTVTVTDTDVNTDTNTDDTENSENSVSFVEENIFRISDVPEFRIIGQVFDTYWLIEYKDELLIIDQHAAHEKVLYEHFVAKMRAKQGMSQSLLAPIVVSLSGREVDVLEANMTAFTQLGFELEPFGEKEYLIKSIPADFLNIDPKELFIDILDTYIDEQKGKKPEMVLDHLATISCKAAVKGNNTLSFAEAKTLIGEMLSLDEPYHCPHGRPTTISMSKYEFEKKFKRIV